MAPDNTMFSDNSACCMGHTHNFHYIYGEKTPTTEKSASRCSECFINSLEWDETYKKPDMLHHNSSLPPFGLWNPLAMIIIGEKWLEFAKKIDHHRHFLFLYSKPLDNATGLIFVSYRSEMTNTPSSGLVVALRTLNERDHWLVEGSEPPGYEYSGDELYNQSQQKHAPTRCFILSNTKVVCKPRIIGKITLSRSQSIDSDVFRFYHKSLENPSLTKWGDFSKVLQNSPPVQHG